MASAAATASGDDLKKMFEEAAASVKTFKPASGAKSVSNDEKLKVYALFKQATEGDVTGSRPGMFSPTDRAKYDARVTVKGKSTDDAMREYIDEVK
eukprot:CAMPEP_0197666942 /NCGR_PEP_ID=MMETSP1338-20131121/64548_1 /TAXON_ID=43686 ORGANISM="Pelagodinium beii, Strain RCC1491" /NCGR_SAMPLE_ID=MMETSP1338 /ASSEMBLY_ACC=CAM_ASM_000754 /LENGTH=95 /DNA_ID=CAMNT_0043246081 /DNA_START=63 /DNA_END=347 /DNA_ORIENTATION=+